MRVYLPATLRSLRRAVEAGECELPADVPAHAVTPALREWYTEGDLEELEYAALLAAGASSLRAVADDPAAPRRRVVLAADVPDSAVAPTSSGSQPSGVDRDGYRSAVRLRVAVAMRDVVSVHVDEEAAQPAVAAAAEALAAADAGDEDARFTVESADGFDLLWYDVTEIPALLVP